MRRALLFLFVAAATATITVAFALGAYPLLTIPAVLFGALWIIAILNKWKVVVVLSALVHMVLPALALIIHLPPGLPVVSAFIAFIAWDLTDFHFRLLLAAADDDIAAIERRHLQVLFMVSLAAGVALFLALQLRLALTFEELVVLIIFSVWGVGRLIRGVLRVGN